MYMCSQNSFNEMNEEREDDQGDSKTSMLFHAHSSELSE